jgi:hypothetical protein
MVVAEAGTFQGGIMAEIDIYVVSDDDLTPFVSKLHSLSPVSVRSVKDMVNRIARLCGSGDRIGTLTIVGEGNEEAQVIGDDLLSNDTLADFTPDLRRLAPLFARGGEVIMGGCRQGRNGTLLLGLSNAFGVPVSGYTALQRALLPGHYGGRTTCFITCTREGFTLADDVDEVILWVRSLIGRIGSMFSDDLPVTPIVINPIPPVSKTGSGSKEIVVVAGDTLSSLANKHYGPMEYWPLLWDANRATIGPNPNRIFPGRRLSVPDFSGFTAAQLMDAKRRFPTWRSYR